MALISEKRPWVLKRDAMSNGEGVFFCSSAAQAEEIMQSQRWVAPSSPHGLSFARRPMDDGSARVDLCCCTCSVAPVASRRLRAMRRAGSFLTMLTYDSAVSDFVLQHHVDRPLLLNGHKFHLRCYVAASEGALWAWGGLSGVEVRLAASKYSGDLTDRLQALTNFAPNRTAAGFFIKRVAAEFPELLGSRLFERLLAVVRRTAGLADLAAATDPARPARGRAAADDGPECEWRGFALLALDVMVDADGALWLLEARRRPMRARTPRVMMLSVGPHQDTSREANLPARVPCTPQVNRGPAAGDESVDDRLQSPPYKQHLQACAPSLHREEAEAWRPPPPALRSPLASHFLVHRIRAGDGFRAAPAGGPAGLREPPREVDRRAQRA